MAAIQQVGDKVDQANNFLSRQLDRGSKAATQALEKKAKTTTNKPLKKALYISTFLTSLGSESEARIRGNELTTMMNQTDRFKAFRSALTDMRGMTESNAPLMRLINPVKAVIDQVRQDFREGVPAELSRAFTRKLSRKQWKQLHKGVARADLLALGLEDTRMLLADPTQARRMEREALEAIQKLAQPLGKNLVKRYQAKAQALASFMVNNALTSEHLLPNAFAIAHLVGERDGPSPDQVTPELVDAIDRLTSLYAYQKLDGETRATMTELMTDKDQAKGMETVTGFLNVVRQQEIERRDRHGATNVVAQMNGMKGYVPALTEEGASLIVSDAEKHDHLVRRGYVRIGDYQGGISRKAGGPFGIAAR